MTANVPAKEIQWEKPAGWTEEPPSSMRVGSFLVTGANGQTADVSIIPLSGPAGGDLANINRWRGQIQLSPLTEGELAQNSERISANGHPMLLVDFLSQELLINNHDKKRLIAAIYTKGDRSWFFKMSGEDQTVELAKPSFLQFLKTLHFAHE